MPTRSPMNLVRAPLFFWSGGGLGGGLACCLVRAPHFPVLFGEPDVPMSPEKVAVDKMLLDFELAGVSLPGAVTLCWGGGTVGSQRPGQGLASGDSGLTVLVGSLPCHPVSTRQTRIEVSSWTFKFAVAS